MKKSLYFDEKFETLKGWKKKGTAKSAGHCPAREKKQNQ